jgi:predicted aspartyl protease
LAYRRGRTFARLTTLAGLLMTLAAAGSGARAEEKRCQLQSLGEIPVTIERGALITEAQINGETVRLIVDTGGFGTLLFEDQARKMGLPLRQTTIETYGVGGASKLYTARVKEFRLGGMAEQNTDLVVAGRSLGAQGILGAKFLLQADVEFDVPHGKIRFFKSQGCNGDEVVYWGEAYAAAPMIPTPDDRIVVDVRVNGEPIVAEMDTGAGVTVLTTAAAARLGMAPGSPGVTPEGAEHGTGRAPVETFVGVFPSFSFGEETIHNATLRIADLFHDVKVLETGEMIATPVSDQPQMLLGADFFRSHRVFVARRQHKVYATYEGGTVFYPIRGPALKASAPTKP